MKKILLLILIISPSLLFSMGWSDWCLYSPGKTRFDNYTGQSVVLYKNGIITENVRCWYFYKNYILGKYNMNDTSLFKYFIYNESNYKLTKYKVYKQWQYSIKKQKLKPMLITRWHSEDWVVLNPILLFLLILWFPITLTLLIFYIYIIVKLIKNKSSKRNKTFMQLILLSTVLILLTRWFLDKFPSSF